MSNLVTETHISHLENWVGRGYFSNRKKQKYMLEDDRIATELQRKNERIAFLMQHLVIFSRLPKIYF